MPAEVPLTGGNSNAGVVRIGDTVRRHMGTASPSIHRLLRHLPEHGFHHGPRFIGIDDKGREILSYLPGRCGILPEYWEQDGYLDSAAQLLRTLHDATIAFPVGAGESWQIVHADPAQHEVICHNDFAPYNLVSDNERFVSVIDFDLAGPGPRLRDIAYAVYWLAPLSQRASDMREPARRDVDDGCRRLKRFCQIYGVEADTALLDWVQRVLDDMASVSLMGRLNDPATLTRLIDEGHLAHWQGEASAFRTYRATIEQQLATAPPAETARPV